MTFSSMKKLFLLLFIFLGFINSAVADTYSTFLDNLINKTSGNSFEGKLNHIDKDVPVVTIFFIDQEDRIVANYIFYEDSNSYIGMLYDCRVLTTRLLNCVWIDEWGDGESFFTFSKDFDSFNGFWNPSLYRDENYIWNGKRIKLHEALRAAEEALVIEDQNRALADAREREQDLERTRIKNQLEAERAAEQLAFEKEQYNRLLSEEIQAEEDLARQLIIEDQLNTLKSAYVNNIAARVYSLWNYRGAQEDWGCDVYVLQDRDGNVQAVNVQNCTLDDSSQARAFKSSIERAVYKASPLPAAPDDAVFDREIMLYFRSN